MKEKIFKYLSKLFGYKVAVHLQNGKKFILLYKNDIMLEAFGDFCSEQVLLFSKFDDKQKDKFKKIVDHKPSQSSLEAVKTAFDNDGILKVNKNGIVENVQKVEDTKIDSDIYAALNIYFNKK